MADVNDIISIDEAARRAHRNRAMIRNFIIEHGLAIPWGTRIKVSWSALSDALAKPRHVTKAGQPLPKASRSLHRLVQC